MALQLRALPRLIPQIFCSDKVAILFGISLLVFGGTLLFYWNLTSFFACFFFATALAFSLFDPVFGFCIYISFIIFRPWELWPTDTIFLIMPRVGALWTMGFALFIYLKERKIFIIKKSGILILFFFWALLTSAKSPVIADALKINLQMIIPSVSLFLLVQFWINDRMDYDLLTDAFSMSVLVTAILAIMLYLESTEDQGRIESMGILSNSNDIAALCILALPFTLKPVFSPEKFIAKRFYPIYFFMSCPLLLVIYYSQSRGAFIALACIVGGWVFIKFKIRWYVIAAFILVTIGGVQFVSLKRGNEDLQQSTESRISYWIAGGNMALRNPIMGVGMGRYPDSFEQYSPSHLYEFGSRTAHSSWVLVLAETGITGFILFASLFVFALKETYKRKNEYPEVFLALLGYVVAMSFLSHSYLFYPYLILGISFAVIRLKPIEVTT